MTISKINAALATVSDPELHKPLTELGMVESVAFESGTATLGILLTISGCPMRDRLTADITKAVTAIAEVNAVKPEIEESDVFNSRLKDPSAFT